MTWLLLNCTQEELADQSTCDQKCHIVSRYGHRAYIRLRRLIRHRRRSEHQLTRFRSGTNFSTGLLAELDEANEDGGSQSASNKGEGEGTDSGSASARASPAANPDTPLRRKVRVCECVFLSNSEYK